MIVLGLTGFLLFALSAATLAVPKSLLKTFFKNVWDHGLSLNQRELIQDSFNCCGFDVVNNADNTTIESCPDPMYVPLCINSTKLISEGVS